MNIPKKGGLRELNCIESESELYSIQKSLATSFLNKIPIPENVYGFVEKKSYKNFLEPHLWENKERYYVRLDIKDFFNSINNQTISDVLKYYFKTDLKQSKEMIHLITEIVCLEGILPQGAVTSPVVSNIVFRQLDLRIEKYCKKLNIKYSRYADDLLFSSTSERIHQAFFVKAISGILNSMKFKLNSSKVKKTNFEISLNGFVVGRDLRLSRSKLRDLNRVYYIYNNFKPKDIESYLKLLNSNEFDNRLAINGYSFLNKKNLLNYLNGYRSFLIDWLPEERSTLLFKKKKMYIKNLESLIIKVNDLN